MINPNVQKLIDKYQRDHMTIKGSALRNEIRKAPPESQPAAWTVYAIIMAASRFKPTEIESTEYTAYDDARDALLNVLGLLIWPDGLSPCSCFRAHLSPERFKAAIERYG